MTLSWHLNACLVKLHIISVINFVTRLLSTGHVTQSCQLLNIPLYKLSIGQRTFYYHMAHIWKNLDSTLKTAKSISTFKFYLKTTE